MKKHTLTLRRDTLGELSTDELGAVVGAAVEEQQASLLPCLINTDPLTKICPTWDCTGCYLTCGC